MVMSNHGKNPLGVLDSERVLFDYILGKPQQPAAAAYEDGEVQSGPVTIQNVFQHHDAHPLLFDLILSKKYDADWLGWDPDALRLEIQEDFNTSVSHLNWSKIQMLRTLHSSTMFWTEWNVFAVVVMGDFRV